MGDWDDMFASAKRQLRPPPGAVPDTLLAACETSTPVSLMAAHMALSCTGHLRAATADGVVVELPHPPSTSLEGAMVALSFPVAGKAAGFTSPVTAIEPNDDGAVNVTLALPDRIQIGVQRAVVRVPVPSNTMRAALLHKETPQPVEAIDVSLKGMLIEFGQGSVPDIEEGHRRMVMLEFDRHEALLEAEIRRRDGPRYGMLFIVRDERPRGLVEIVAKLQYLWSRRRLHELAP